jgi:uncharacterized protein YerC
MKKELHAKIAAYIQNHPELTYQQMKEKTGISVPTLSTIAIKHGIRRGKNTGRYKVNADLLKVLEG